MLRLTAVLALSLLIHFLMYGGVLVLPPAPRPSDSTVSIEVIDHNPEPKPEKKPDHFDKPVVQNTQKQPQPSDMKDPADFMAEHTQRFKEQTKAVRIGKMQNRNQTPQEKTQQAKTKQEGAKKPANDGDMPEFAREIQNQLAQEQAHISSVPYELPDEIKAGNATNLNADAHIYASFYSRILNLFYVRWSQRLDTIFERLPTQTKRELSGKVWVTDIEVWLNEDGLFESGKVTRSSGFKLFDDAGIYAFKDAKFFPNPPRAKVQADGGRVRLRYRIAFHIW